MKSAARTPANGHNAGADSVRDRMRAASHPKRPVRFARSACLAVCALLSGCSGSDGPTTNRAGPPISAAAERPNIIVILTDDQAPRTLGIEGNDTIKTPHIDRLAREGVYFSRAYVPLPQCAPSRAAMLTGRYPHEFGPLNNDEARLDRDLPTIAELLRKQGYRCGLVGKWHLTDPLEKQAGFDDYWVAYDKTGNPRVEKYTRPTVVVNGESSRAEQYLTDVFGDHALKFIDESADQAFFLWLAFHAPHTPITPHPDFRYEPAAIELPVSIEDDLSDKPAAQRGGLPHRQFAGMTRPRLRRLTVDYYSMISAIDANVGRIVAHLKKRGLAKNTLIVFLSDNGWMIGEHQMYSKGAAFYEELVRTPLIVWQPGTVPAGTSSAALVSTLDLFPTLAQRGGVQDVGAVPGKSMWPLVTGESAQIHDAVFLEYQQKGSPAAFQPLLGVVTERFKFVRYLESGDEELYDLSADPFELKNLANAADFAKQRAALAERLEGFQATIAKPFWERE